MINGRLLPAAASLLSAAFLAGCSHTAIDFSGYYYYDEEITSLPTGESSTERSWIRLLPRADGGYDLTGTIVGANYHVCHIQAADGGPLHMEEEGEFILYTESVPMDVGQVACSLMIMADGEDLVLLDPGNNCSRWLFAAGARVTLDDLRFPMVRYRTREYYELLEMEEDR